MFEAPVENELGGLHRNSGRTDSQVSAMIPCVILSAYSGVRAKRWEMLDHNHLLILVSTQEK